MQDRVNFAADPEKVVCRVDADKLPFSGEDLNISLPSFPLEGLENLYPEIAKPIPKKSTYRPRFTVNIAPIETYRKDHEGHIERCRPRGIQAVHCPVCKVLLAIGQSFEDHTYFCRKVRP
jgi:hypothetical protein